MVIHDEEFAPLLAQASVERRVIAWTDGGIDGETLESLVQAYDESDLHPPERHARIVILTSGTTGTPKGRAPQGGRHRRGGVAALADAAASGMAYAHRGAALPHLGLRTPRPGHAARLHGRAAPHLRPGDRAAHDPGPAVPVDGRDPRDAPADARPRPRGPRRHPARRAGGRGVLGVGAAGHAGAGLDGPLRREPLQHLRLDRGRLRLDRDARGPARGRDLGRQAALRHGREDPRRRTATSCPSARRGASSSATGCSSRATPAAGPRRSSTG